MGKRPKGEMHIARIIEAAIDQGFRVTTTRSGHMMFRSPDPARGGTTYSGTPGDVRAIRNLLSTLRRMGFVYPPAADRRS